MAAETKPVLREFQPLINILQTVPHRLQKGLFSQDIEWTCLDVTKEYLAVGTDVGIAFLYDRHKGTVKRLQCPVRRIITFFYSLNLTILIIPEKTCIAPFSWFSYPDIWCFINAYIIICIYVVPAHQTSDMSHCTISPESRSKLEMVILSSLRFLTI